MTQATAKRIRLIYGIFLCVTIILAGICLMACCTHLYVTGDHTYTPEKVAAYFSLIAIPIYLCLAAILGGFLLNLLLPADGKKKAGLPPAYMTLARVKRKTLAAGPVLTADLEKEEKRRSMRRLLTVGLLIAAFTVIFLYGLTPAHFTESINASVIRGFLVMAVCLVLPFGTAIFTVYSNNASMQKEAELRKQANMDIPVPTKTYTQLSFMVARMAILVIALALLVLGLMGNGTKDVLTKAINICTECIGLG